MAKGTFSIDNAFVNVFLFEWVWSSDHRFCFWILSTWSTRLYIDKCPGLSEGKSKATTTVPLPRARYPESSICRLLWILIYLIYSPSITASITAQHPPSSYDTSTLRLFANTSAPNRQTQCSLDTLDTDRPGKLYRRAWHLAQRTTPRNSKVLANQLYTPINPSHD